MRRSRLDKRSCNTCGEHDISKLVPDKSRPHGVRNMCRICRCKDQRGGKTRNHHLRRKYGITLVDELQMLEEQKGLCRICKRHQDVVKFKFHVDHCHKTGKIRGLLCNKCNQALGNVSDSIEILYACIDYLKSFG